MAYSLEKTEKKTRRQVAGSGFRNEDINFFDVSSNLATIPSIGEVFFFSFFSADKSC